MSGLMTLPLNLQLPVQVILAKSELITSTFLRRLIVVWLTRITFTLGDFQCDLSALKGKVLKLLDHHLTSFHLALVLTDPLCTRVGHMGSLMELLIEVMI